MSHSMVSCGVVALLAFGACVSDDSGDLNEESQTEQDLDLVPALFRWSQNTSQVIDVTPVQAGSVVALAPVGIATQQRWQLLNQHLVLVAHPQFCLQPENANVGARLTIQLCVSLAQQPLQGWQVGIGQNKVTQISNLLTHLLVDASAGAFGQLRMQPFVSNKPAQSFIFQALP